MSMGDKELLEQSIFLILVEVIYCDKNKCAIHKTL